MKYNNTQSLQVSMRVPVFLNSIHVHGLYECSFEQTFIKNNRVEPINRIRINSEDEADMWSAVIEILTSLGDYTTYPSRDSQDWIIIFVYSVWDTPLDLFDKPYRTVQVRIECIDGQINESAYEIRDGLYIEIDNDNHSTDGFSHLDSRVLEDIGKLNFYRWNPRLDNVDVICDFDAYFLGFHQKWYNQDPVGYKEELEGVLHSLRNSFEELIIDKNERNNTIKLSILENDTKVIIPIDRMDDDFRNFFYSYAEFKYYKDYQSGCMGFYMIDCKSSIYISIYITMLASTYTETQSQFFFMYWNDDKLDKLQRNYIAQMDY